MRREQMGCSSENALFTDAVAVGADASYLSDLIKNSDDRIEHGIS